MEPALSLHHAGAMRRLAPILAAALAACADGATLDDASDPAYDDGKGDNGASTRFREIDTTHTNRTFRTYIHRALDELAASDAEIAKHTLRSIRDGRVLIDELADLTCADFQRVRADLPDLGLTNADHATLKKRGSPTTKAIANEIDGYMWSNRIYVSRGQDPLRLAATFVHEVNHVVNRSEVGYYDDLPTSAFVHEYRAFHAESLFDASYWEGTDLVDYVLVEYELDRTKVAPEILAAPLTETLIPDAAAWRARDVASDVDEPADCTP